MFAYEYLLAAALLVAPPDSAEAAVAPETVASLRTALQKLAVEWEILDPKELSYVLARPEDFAADLNLLRRRRQDLEDAPPMNDCLRFPDRETVTQLLAFNRAYREHIDVRQPVDSYRSEELRTALQETDHLYQIWDTLRDVRCDYYHVNVRRQALKKLRGMLGNEAYYRAQLPPYVPLWRFQEID